MAVVSPFGQYEAACRLNLRGTFFPIVEAGWGLSDHTDETTDIHYKTGAPYFRVGCDYNFANNKRSGNRIYGGLRYGFSSFSYDVDGPDIVDAVWGHVDALPRDGRERRRPVGRYRIWTGGQGVGTAASGMEPALSGTLVQQDFVGGKSVVCTRLRAQRRPFYLRHLQYCL